MGKNKKRKNRSTYFKKNMNSDKISSESTRTMSYVMFLHGFGIWMILINTISFESGPQNERGPGVECFLHAARKVNILVQDPFYLEDPFQDTF